MAFTPAELAIYAAGKRRGYDDGYSRGYKKGFSDGRDATNARLEQATAKDIEVVTQLLESPGDWDEQALVTKLGWKYKRVRKAMAGYIQAKGQGQ